MQSILLVHWMSWQLPRLLAFTFTDCNDNFHICLSLLFFFLFFVILRHMEHFFVYNKNIIIFYLESISYTWLNIRGRSFLTSAFFWFFWTPPPLPPVSKCQIFVAPPLSASVRFLILPPTHYEIFHFVRKIHFLNPWLNKKRRIS